MTDDIYEETWRRLLEFANLELTIDEITRRHGIPQSKSDRANYTKQAKQARLCVLQAKEYFDSARESSLFTSPNHAYYGAVSLASLIMLVVGDGTRSLDSLRNDKRNAHHGLALTTNATATTATQRFILLEHTQAEILEHGHFANFYNTLPNRGNVYATHTTVHHGARTTNYRLGGGFDVPAFSSLVGTKSTVLELLKYLPDLSQDLDRFGVSVSKSRMSHEIEVVTDKKLTHTWLLHGCKSESARDELLGKFSVVPNFAENMSCVVIGDSAIVKLVVAVPAAEVGITWPTARETMNHDVVCYSDARETHEIVDLYLVAYQLSMLSRYFPDIWISCIESQCRGAKLIERSMEVIIKKLPILALSKLSAEDVVISTHREPWKS